MTQINTPTGFGGLQRFSEEYKSKIRFTPTQIVIFLIAIVIFVAILKIFWPMPVG